MFYNPYSIGLAFIEIEPPLIQVQQPRVDCHNHGARRHQNGTDGGAQNNPPRIQSASGEWDGKRIVASRAEEILHHLGVCVFDKRNQVEPRPRRTGLAKKSDKAAV